MKITKKSQFESCGGARNCPVCGKVLYSKTYDGWLVALKRQSKCMSCSQMGKIQSEESNEKRRAWNNLHRGNKFELAGRSRVCPLCEDIIVYSHYRTWWRAAKENSCCEHCAKSQNGKHNKGLLRSDEFRLKKSKEVLGRKHSEETKRKLRKLKAERFLRLNIGTSVDKGATEYFIGLNSSGKSIETTKYFSDIGYFADGYDPKDHIWYEYDTKYHSTRIQREKDMIRQNNIIDYFKSIGNPLRDFVRIKE
jgi:hypothetical protein